MDDPIDIAGAKLFERFSRGGFNSLIDDEPMRLSEHLNLLSRQAGRGSMAAISELVRIVYGFLIDEDGPGGIAFEFLKELDHLVVTTLSSMRNEGPTESMSSAIQLKSKVQSMIEKYNPGRYAT
jgi:hypothetical protein